MPVRIAIPDLISPSYFPLIAAVELGCFAAEDLEATIELVFPVTETYRRLREGEVEYVGGSAHAALYAFENWQGCKLLAALSQSMYWFLVVRSDLEVERGDLEALRGLRIGAAPGPVDGLRVMLRQAGVDPDTDVEVSPVPGAEGAGVSFGVTAAKALADRKIDGFWANGMGAEVALDTGTGRLVVDVRRGDGPAGAEDYTFAALAAADSWIRERPDEVAKAVAALVAAQRRLREDPGEATEAARRAGFPQLETSLIERLIQRDAPFYDPAITSDKVTAMNRFARDLGILGAPQVAFEQVVATDFRGWWTR